MFTSTSVLVHFDASLPITLATDASSYGLGAALSHVFPNGDEKPIAFASRSLSALEVNYAQMEKEALSIIIKSINYVLLIIFGVKKFHQYLYGKKFVLITDHKPLATILGPKSGVPTLAACKSNAKMVFNFICILLHYRVYHSTAQHGNADAFSQVQLPSPRRGDHRDIDSRMNFVHMTTLPLNHHQLRSATRRDPACTIESIMFRK